MTLSLITVCRNAATTLTDTMESVLAQTYPDIEYLVIDGASTDGTVDLIRRYEPRFGGRLRWVSEPDKGLYDALNKGLRMARGEIVGIIHSDDFFVSHGLLSEVVRAFEGDKTLDAVYGDLEFVQASKPEKVVRRYSSHIFHPPLVRLGFIPAHPTFYARRSCYERFGDYDTSYRICADFDLLVRFLYLHRIRTRYLPLPFLKMRMGGLSTRGLSSRRCIMQEHLRSLKSHGILSNRFLLSLRYLYKLTELRPFH
jgi:glycosyltransferase involved in cell wall biosynthesis